MPGLQVMAQPHLPGGSQTHLLCDAGLVLFSGLQLPIWRVNGPDLTRGPQTSLIPERFLGLWPQASNHLNY